MAGLDLVQRLTIVLDFRGVPVLQLLAEPIEGDRVRMTLLAREDGVAQERVVGLHGFYDYRLASE